MNERVNQPTLEFEKAIEFLRPIWRGIDIRALCNLQNNLLLRLIACLTPDYPKPVETADQTQEVAFIRGIISIEELDRLLVACAMVPLFWNHILLAQKNPTTIDSTLWIGLGRKT